MKKLLLLPNWIILRLFIIPFLPKTHAWYGKKFTLKNWANHSTELDENFAFVFWFGGIMILLIILNTILR